jgi:hypothetical protein
MKKEVPSCVEWMFKNGVDPADARLVDERVNSQVAAEVRRQRGLKHQQDIRRENGRNRKNKRSGT